jgi:hypothetical protein
MGSSASEEHSEQHVMNLLQALIQQAPDYPYVFLGNNRHTFGEDQPFKTEEELNDFARFWNAQVSKPY